MVKLEPTGFPNRHLDCYESALMSIFKYMGLANETPLMGTQAYFVLEKERLNVYSRFHFISEEWKRIHSLAVKSVLVDNEADLRDEVVSRLGNGTPVCLTTDIYFLPHTSHHERLHQVHFVDVFGYDNERYYIVCPYYRFTGWMDADVVHASFFSSALGRRYLMFVPEVKCETLAVERVQSLVRESCEYMLGLAVPEVQSGTPRQCLGLAGIRAFSTLLRELTATQGNLPHQAFMLSAQTVAIGYSRYWFHRLIETCQPYLLPAGVMDNLERRFTDVIRLWKASGARFGAAAHADDREMMTRATRRLEEVYQQEYQLFNLILGALPGYEEGKL